MTIESLRALIAPLQISSNALAAIGSAIEARMRGVPSSAHVDDVLTALGAKELVERASLRDLRPLLGELRCYALTNAKLLDTSRTQDGWTHLEAAILRAAGDVSVAFPSLLRDRIMPRLEGLVDRLASPGAVFLDVGVGVATLAIEMARCWPALFVVGIDPWAPALALARESVGAAGLDDRIELREQAGEQLTDVDAFDLAWIASAFIPGAAIVPLVHRVHCALRPGAWLLFPMIRAGNDPLTAALVRMRVAMFGGAPRSAEEIGALLRGEGFGEVETLSTESMAMVVARRVVERLG